MSRSAALALLIAIAPLPGHALAETVAEQPEAAPYDDSISEAAYAQELEHAIALLAPGQKVLAVFGANWCHDSRALAGWLTSPDFEPLLRDHFEVVFVDVGSPQTGAGRNLDLAARYGVSDIAGTPNLLVIDADGTLVNTPESAKRWRNAASRSEESIYAFLESYTFDPPAVEGTE
ncbi:MAG: thioredoxin family protein [Erythrobacter sp.]|nr:thioredoxin family protein [Erythrobacter sp.]NCQ64522.1 thioredoxin family protein [Alphaproteobacteria bacterium]